MILVDAGGQRRGGRPVVVDAGAGCDDSDAFVFTAGAAASPAPARPLPERVETQR